MIAARLTVQAQASRRLLSNRGLASQLLARPKEEWSYTELRREARERGIVQGGNKAALLARLQADDLTRAGQSQKGISTSTPATAPKAAPKASSSSKVVAPEDTPVNATPSPAPERAAFKSSRTIRPGPSESVAPQIPGIPTSDNPFAPKRSAPLFVAIPREEDPPEEGPIIPVVPENYGSSLEESASPTQVEDTPKIHAVSGIDEHLATPAHETATSPSASTSAPGGSWTEALSTVGKVLNESRVAFGKQLGGPHYADHANAPLTQEERKGLIYIGGILFGGWFLGGLLAPGSEDK